jgi:hypothetical protein
MEEEKGSLLNEERYQRSKRKIKSISIIILIIGILLGSLVILRGLKEHLTVNFKYSDKHLAEVKEEYNKEKEVLGAKKKALLEKGVQFSYFAKNTDGDAYDLMMIVTVLEGNRCGFNEYKRYELTQKYCEIENELNDLSDRDFNKSFAGANSLKYYMIGGFVIFTFGMVAFYLYINSKQREILAFHAQGLMPLAEESADKLSDISASMMEKMAPAMGRVAKEIAKGAKEGEEEVENNRVVECPKCGARNVLTTKVGECEYCHAPID